MGNATQTVQTGHEQKEAAFARLPVLVVAALAGVALLATSGRYAHGFDELYFLMAGRDHLAWGYFDQPPLIPALAGAMDSLFPGSLTALRLPMTLATAGGVVVTALIARELGGGRGAQVLAAGFSATSGVIIVSHWIGTYVLDPFLWTVIVWLVVRWVRTRRDGLLVWAGVVTAVSLETKFLIPAFWVIALLSALVFGPRELVRRPKLWLGAGIAVVATVPTLLWQAKNGWPYLIMNEVVSAEFPGTWPFLRDGFLTAGVGVGVLAFVYGLVLLIGSRGMRDHRFLGVAIVALILAFLLLHGRSYYLMSVFALPFAAAATGFVKHVPRWRLIAWPAVVLSAVVTVAGLPIYPAGMTRTSIGPVTLGSSFAGGELPQRDLAKMIGETYASLPPEQRARTAVYAEIYPFAAAVEFYGPQYGIENVYSGHRGYWYFDKPPETADSVLFAGFDPGLLKPYFAEVTPVVEGLLWRYDGRRGSWNEIWPKLERH
ncbi:ArnT family glycosyltransferase [Amycolatopsis pittospori]|uniref:ArnT family glycosyltransferase n=1 Tax=Amycolatopsis pittospori TaxID=2749434 RepID=UPI0015F044B8|nr:glycosyltransferase family 39 protein [Amycolatopsis pittospori]